MIRCSTTSTPASARSLLALAFAFAIGVAAPSTASTLQLTIQPIQVCNDTGSSCANVGQEVFSALDNTIWAQADIWLEFLGWTTLDSSSLLATGFETLTAAGHGQNAAPFVINVWFVDQIADCGGVFGAYGCAYIDGNGVAIADSVFDLGRIDTIAHELGHNLGLEHTATPLNLMASGGVRTIPGSIDDVYPLGAMTDQLTASQIVTARSSQFLSSIESRVPVPEPATWLLIALGAGVIGGSRRLWRGRKRPPDSCRQASSGRPDGWPTSAQPV